MDQWDQDPKPGAPDWTTGVSRGAVLRRSGKRGGGGSNRRRRRRRREAAIERLHEFALRIDAALDHKRAR